MLVQAAFASQLSLPSAHSSSSPAKVATQYREPSSVTSTEGEVPLQSPVQPTKVDPSSGVAVRVTVWPNA